MANIKVETKQCEAVDVTVLPGDNLSKIAQEAGVSASELQKGNPHLTKTGAPGPTDTEYSVSVNHQKPRKEDGSLIYPDDIVQIKGATRFGECPSDRLRAAGRYAEPPTPKK